MTTKRRTQVERRQEAESRIIKSAIDLIAEKGLSGLTLAAAGEGAGYSRGIASHHFGKKDDLLMAVVDQITSRFSDEMSKSAEPGLPMLQVVIKEYFQRAKKNPRNTKALHILLSEGVFNPALQASLAEVNARSIKGLAFHIRRGMDNGQVRADVDPKAQALIILASLRGITAQWLVDNQRVALGVIEKEFIANVMGSLQA